MSYKLKQLYYLVEAEVTDKSWCKIAFFASRIAGEKYAEEIKKRHKCNTRITEVILEEDSEVKKYEILQSVFESGNSSGTCD